MVAFDEAHWVSYTHTYDYHVLSRGDSFRKSFQEVGLKAIIEAPFMALTASASPAVEAKIMYLSSPVTISW